MNSAPSALHVLTLTPFFPSAENEVSGCFIAESLDQLKTLGVDSTVIAVSPMHYPRKNPIPSAAAEWVRYPQLPGNLGLSSAGKLLYARLAGKLRTLHRAKPIDVIHAHTALPCGHAAALLSKDLNVPFVVSLHGLDVFNTCFLDGIPARWRRKVSIDVYRAAETVICISGRVQEVLRTGASSTGASPEMRSTVVYNGVNPSFFSPDRSEEGSSEEDATKDESEGAEILMVGNLLRGKGHELVLRAMGQLQNSFAEIRCTIIGEGPDRAHYEALARELNISDRVQFRGRQGRAAVAEAMRRCSVFVLPSRYEGLGCVYLETMSCAKPVIACHGQGIDEVIEHGKNGWLIPIDGLEELVQGLTTLLGSVQVRARIGEEARRTIVDRFTLAHQAEQLAAIYRQARQAIS
ncbi:MAG TPA: glycosyltransferase [Terriglobales bacterium]|nr:glycosyltransferase [Terriglobales bacterium]